MAKQFKDYLLGILLFVCLEVDECVLSGGGGVDVLAVAVLSQFVVHVQTVLLNVVECEEGPLAEAVRVPNVVLPVQEHEGVLLVVLVEDALQFVRNLLEVDEPLRLEELQALHADGLGVQLFELAGDLHRFVEHGVVKLSRYCYFGTHF